MKENINVTYHGVNASELLPFIADYLKNHENYVLSSIYQNSRYERLDPQAPGSPRKLLELLYDVCFCTRSSLEIYDE